MLWPFKDKLNIKYIVAFTGDASKTYRKKINATPDIPTEDYCYISDTCKQNESIEPLNFSEKKYKLININVMYNNPGTYQIPRILIEDKPYVFKDMVTVDTPLERNKDSILFFMAIFGFLIGLIFNKELKNASKTHYSSLKRLIAGGEAQEEKSADRSVDIKTKEEAAKEISRLILEAIERGSNKKK